MNNELKEIITEILIREEGYRSRYYYCTENKLTIAIGRNLEDMPLTKKERAYLDFYEEDYKLLEVNLQQAKWLLSRDIEKFYNRLCMNLDWFSEYNNIKAKAVLICMSYQIGVSGVLKFKNTLRYMKNKQFKLMSEEMLDSKWYREDTPERAKRMSEIILELE